MAGYFYYNPLFERFCLHAIRFYVMASQESEDDYSLTVNLRRLYQLQLAVNISDSHLLTDLQGILANLSNLEDEVNFRTTMFRSCFAMINMDDISPKDFAL
jgi:hypothetical protein